MPVVAKFFNDFIKFLGVLFLIWLALKLLGSGHEAPDCEIGATDDTPQSYIDALMDHVYDGRRALDITKFQDLDMARRGGQSTGWMGHLGNEPFFVFTHAEPDGQLIEVMFMVAPETGDAAEWWLVNGLGGWSLERFGDGADNETRDAVAAAYEEAQGDGLGVRNVGAGTVVVERMDSDYVFTVGRRVCSP